jgi:hypothetical protein
MTPVPRGRCRWSSLPPEARGQLRPLLDGPAWRGLILRGPAPAVPGIGVELLGLILGLFLFLLPLTCPLGLCRLLGDGLRWAALSGACSALGAALLWAAGARLPRRWALRRGLGPPPAALLTARGALRWDGRWIEVWPVPSRQPQVERRAGRGGAGRAWLRWEGLRFELPPGVDPAEAAHQVGARRRAEEAGAACPEPWGALGAAIQADARRLAWGADERALGRLAPAVGVLVSLLLFGGEARTLLAAAVEGAHLAREGGEGVRLHARALGLARIDDTDGPRARFLVAATSPGAAVGLQIDAPAPLRATGAALADRVLVDLFGAPLQLVGGAPRGGGPALVLRLRDGEAALWMVLSDGTHPLGAAPADLPALLGGPSARAAELHRLTGALAGGGGALRLAPPGGSG